MQRTDRHPAGQATHRRLPPDDDEMIILLLLGIFASVGVSVNV